MYIKIYEIFESELSKKDKIELPSLSQLKIVSVKTIEGKNKWHTSKDKLVHMVLDLGEWEKFPSNKIPEFYENIKKYLQSMDEHRCSVGRRGGFYLRVKKGTWLGHIIEHIALELQTLSGDNTGFGRTRQTDKKGEYNVIFNYENKKAGMYAARESVKIVKKIIRGLDPEIKKSVEKLKHLK
jgi:cyanophycin synthetase